MIVECWAIYLWRAGLEVCLFHSILKQVCCIFGLKVPSVPSFIIVQKSSQTHDGGWVEDVWGVALAGWGTGFWRGR